MAIRSDLGLQVRNNGGPQLRLEHDASFRTDITTSSTGVATIQATAGEYVVEGSGTLVQVNLDPGGVNRNAVLRGVVGAGGRFQIVSNAATGGDIQLLTNDGADLGLTVKEGRVFIGDCVFHYFTSISVNQTALEGSGDFIIRPSGSGGPTGMPEVEWRDSGPSAAGFHSLRLTASTSAWRLVPTQGGTPTTTKTSFEITGSLRFIAPYVQTSNQGSATVPAFQIGGTASGLYVQLTDRLNVTVNGNQVAYFNRFGLATSWGLTMTSGYRIYNDPGTAASPGYAFRTDNDTGMYLVAVGQIGFSLAGSLLFRITGGTTTGVYFENSVNVPFKFCPGTVLQPGISFRGAGSEDEQGFWLDSNDLVVVTNQIERMRFAASGQITVTDVVLSLANSGTSNVVLSFDNSGGQLGTIEGQNGVGIALTDGTNNQFVVQTGAATVPNVLNIDALLRFRDGATVVGTFSAPNTTTVLFNTPTSAEDLLIQIDSNDAIRVQDSDVTFSKSILMSSALQVQLDSGTAAAPGLAFNGDTNVGLYRVSNDVLGVAANGSQVFTFSAVAAVAVIPIRTGDGSAAAPSYSFSSESNTGMYRIGAGILGFSTASTERARLSAAGFVLTVETFLPNGSTTTPALTFSSRSNTGLYMVPGATAADAELRYVKNGVDLGEIGGGLSFYNGANSFAGLASGTSTTVTVTVTGIAASDRAVACAEVGSGGEAVWSTIEQITTNTVTVKLYNGGLTTESGQVYVLGWTP